MSERVMETDAEYKARMLRMVRHLRESAEKAESERDTAIRERDEALKQKRLGDVVRRDLADVAMKAESEAQALRDRCAKLEEALEWVRQHAANGTDRQVAADAL